MERWFLALLFTAWMYTSFAQKRQSGLLFSDERAVSDGYVLFYPHHQGTVFLINNCGAVVHRWTDSTYLPANGAELMADGTIYIAKGHGDSTTSMIRGGGGGEKIERRSWNNELLWEYTYCDSFKRMHHDFAVLPNGNVVLIAWEEKKFKELLHAGRDSASLNDCKLWVDHLVEVKPVGKDSGQIVWEWHAWDHIIQDTDPAKPNYGDPSHHPEKININNTYVSGYTDWLHLNSVDYDPVQDILLVSSPTMGEVWMIDHSTTTAQAATDTGGNFGRGGDLIYRWGNPSRYNKQSNSEQHLRYQHDAHWADIAFQKDDPRRNTIVIFDNKSGSRNSAVVFVEPQQDSLFAPFRMKDSVFLPVSATQRIEFDIPFTLFSETSSSAQWLPNGNVFICSGRTGHFIELDSSGKICWEYKTPLVMGDPVSAYRQIAPSENINFRAKKYPADWPAFSGKDLHEKGFVETDASPGICQTIQLEGYLSHLHLTFDPIDRSITIQGLYPKETYTIVVYDMFGHIVSEMKVSNGETVSPVLPYEEGTLFTLRIIAPSGSYRKWTIIR